MKLAHSTVSKVSLVGDWTLHEYGVCTSTNLVAAQLPAWNAVRADTQTKGRGRFERSWVSDEGGLWLSAVVPVRQKSPAWRFLPVAVGFAVCRALASLGARELRLRWPNDVLVGPRKLAGLLLDQFCPDLVVAGIGINVRNHPENHDGALSGHTIRLADIIPETPPLSVLAGHILHSTRAMLDQLSAGGPGDLLSEVNSLWQAPRRVRLNLDEGEVCGEFVGVDLDGRLELHRPGEPTQFFDPQQVKCLRETE